MKHLEGNLRISELIIESLKLILTRKEKTSTKSTTPEASVSIIAKLKSATYQAFNSIIRINDKLIVPIVAFVMGQLKKVNKFYKNRISPYSYYICNYEHQFKPERKDAKFRIILLLVKLMSKFNQRILI